LATAFAGRSRAGRFTFIASALDRERPHWLEVRASSLIEHFDRRVLAGRTRARPRPERAPQRVVASGSSSRSRSRTRRVERGSFRQSAQREGLLRRRTAPTVQFTSAAGPQSAAFLCQSLRARVQRGFRAKPPAVLRPQQAGVRSAPVQRKRTALMRTIARHDAERKRRHQDRTASARSASWTSGNHESARCCHRFCAELIGTGTAVASMRIATRTRGSVGSEAVQFRLRQPSELRSRRGHAMCHCTPPCVPTSSASTSSCRRARSPHEHDRRLRPRATQSRYRQLQRPPNERASAAKDRRRRFGLTSAAGPLSVAMYARACGPAYREVSCGAIASFVRSKPALGRAPAQRKRTRR